MSRIGKKAINLPENIEVSINESKVNIKGPKGKLSHQLPKDISVEERHQQLKLNPNNVTKKTLALYGLSRTILNNMVIGVSSGFSKELEIHGVGYRCQMEGNNLILNVGYSHPVIIQPGNGIYIEVENNTIIRIKGINKELVGQTAAKIRSIRPPEPYKGKGIKYRNEKINRKVGKAGK